MANRIGRYELAELLGEGAHGQFFRGHDPATGREVAVQLIRLDPKMSIEAREAALRDARNARALSHRGIAAIYDFGVDGESAFVVRELVDGKSLAKYAAESAPFRPVAVVAWLEQIADALDYAHASGVVHGALEPSYAIVSSTGTVKLTGFGSSKLAARPAGALGGAPEYMAPEKIRGEAVGAPADVYALGAVVYELLSGGPPFASDSAVTTIFKAVNEPPPSIATLTPEISDDVDAVVRRALSKSPDDRFPSCRSFVETFRVAAAAAAEVPAEPVVETPVDDAGGLVSAIFCDQCGAALRPGVKFCYKCGAATVAAEAPESEPAPPPPPPAPAPVITAPRPRPETVRYEPSEPRVQEAIPVTAAAPVPHIVESIPVVAVVESSTSGALPTERASAVATAAAAKDLPPPLAGYAASTHAGELPPPGADLGGKPKSGLLSGMLPVVIILLLVLFLFGMFGFWMAPRLLKPAPAPPPAQTSAVG